MPRLPKNIVPAITLALVLGGAAFCAYMGMGFDEFRARHGHEHHHHTAPHGGTLFVLGLHSAHVELVFDPESAALDLYALDGHAAELYTLRAEPIALETRAASDGPWIPVTLTPSEEPAHRPTPAFAARFRGVAAHLAGLERFEVRLPELEIAGTRYRGVTAWYPEGNE